ncbi:hypothetical protein EYF80_040847 [Liparis tanakae]|uniref:Uncharacterized protein n=1 Tax=Liparis tanakae TaxID=230148 RepID=A0A4Z2G5V6_9TELE|nr:hypothetical protein EYF80_040847 [Liparis tanakae]
MASTSVVKLGLDLYFWMTEERRVLPAHSMNTWRRRGAGLRRALLPVMGLDDTGRDGTGSSKAASRSPPGWLPQCSGLYCRVGGA